MTTLCQMEIFNFLWLNWVQYLPLAPTQSDIPPSHPQGGVQIYPSANLLGITMNLILHQQRFRGGMVKTSALYTKGRRFEPHRRRFFTPTVVLLSFKKPETVLWTIAKILLLLSLLLNGVSRRKMPLRKKNEFVRSFLGDEKIVQIFLTKGHLQE